jgi:hypothetical protein
VKLLALLASMRLKGKMLSYLAVTEQWFEDSQGAVAYPKVEFDEAAFAADLDAIEAEIHKLIAERDASQRRTRLLSDVLEAKTRQLAMEGWKSNPDRAGGYIPDNEKEQWK